MIFHHLVCVLSHLRGRVVHVLVPKLGVRAHVALADLDVVQVLGGVRHVHHNLGLQLAVALFSLAGEYQLLQFSVVLELNSFLIHSLQNVHAQLALVVKLSLLNPIGLFLPLLLPIVRLSVPLSGDSLFN